MTPCSSSAAETVTNGDAAGKTRFTSAERGSQSADRLEFLRVVDGEFCAMAPRHMARDRLISKRERFVNRRGVQRPTVDADPRPRGGPGARGEACGRPAGSPAASGRHPDAPTVPGRIREMMSNGMMSSSSARTTRLDAFCCRQRLSWDPGTVIGGLRFGDQGDMRNNQSPQPANPSGARAVFDSDSG